MKKLVGLAAATAFAVSAIGAPALAGDDNQPNWPGCKGDLTSANAHLNQILVDKGMGAYVDWFGPGTPGDVNKTINSFCKFVNSL